jgi:hypothetical protein
MSEHADLAELTRVYGPFEAEVIKSFLESHGIVSAVRGRIAPFIYPVTVDGLAECKILVQAADLEKARELIASIAASDDDEGPEKAA